MDSYKECFLTIAPKGNQNEVRLFSVGGGRWTADPRRAKEYRAIDASRIAGKTRYVRIMYVDDMDNYTQDPEGYESQLYTQTVI